jgi:Ca2+-binding RTX toxin-like protein
MDFPSGEATFERPEGSDSLVVRFDEGGTVELQGFYAVYGTENLPDFEVDGQFVPGADFLAAFGPDLLPAAGPGQTPGSRGYHDYANDTLADGLDHLEGLDYTHSPSQDPPTSPRATGMPDEGGRDADPGTYAAAGTGNRPGTYPDPAETTPPLEDAGQSRAPAQPLPNVAQLSETDMRDGGTSVFEGILAMDYADGDFRWIPPEDAPRAMADGAWLDMEWTVSEDGRTLTGTVNGVPALTAVLDDPATGHYRVELATGLDHGTADVTRLAMDIGYVVGSGEDAITGSLAVQVDDDTPRAKDSVGEVVWVQGDGVPVGNFAYGDRISFMQADKDPDLYPDGKSSFAGESEITVNGATFSTSLVHYDVPGGQFTVMTPEEIEAMYGKGATAGTFSATEGYLAIVSNSADKSSNHGADKEITYDMAHQVGEAVTIRLDGIAYGLQLDLAKFYANGYQGDNGESARINLYLDGQLVFTMVCGGTSADGNYTVEVKTNDPSLATPTLAFDTVVIAAMDNCVPGSNNSSNSDFDIKAVKFLTYEEAVILEQRGEVSGLVDGKSADGVAFAFGASQDGDVIHTSIGDLTLHVSADGTNVLATCADQSNAFQAFMDPATGAWSYLQYKEFATDDGSPVLLDAVAVDGDGDATRAEIVILDQTQSTATVLGTASDDTLSGDSGGDHIFGFDGNDTLFGKDGHDDLHGGAGNDVLFGGAGNDALFGGLGDDRLYGDEGNDFLDGGAGHDVLYGGLGNDLMVYHDGDEIHGGPGLDVLLTTMTDPGSVESLLSTATDTEVVIGGLPVDISVRSLADMGITLDDHGLHLDRQEGWHSEDDGHTYVSDRHEGVVVMEGNAVHAEVQEAEILVSLGSA